MEHSRNLNQGLHSEETQKENHNDLINENTLEAASQEDVFNSTIPKKAQSAPQIKIKRMEQREQRERMEQRERRERRERRKRMELREIREQMELREIRERRERMELREIREQREQMELREIREQREQMELREIRERSVKRGEIQLAKNYLRYGRRNVSLAISFQLFMWYLSSIYLILQLGYISKSSEDENSFFSFLPSYVWYVVHTVVFYAVAENLYKVTTMKERVSTEDYDPAAIPMLNNLLRLRKFYKRHCIDHITGFDEKFNLILYREAFIHREKITVDDEDVDVTQATQEITDDINTCMQSLTFKRPKKNNIQEIESESTSDFESPHSKVENDSMIQKVDVQVKKDFDA